jgi:hypothetical protein
MISIKRKWMQYTYFERNASARSGTTHLFSFDSTNKPLVTTVPFKTMTVDISQPDFLKKWSSSTRNKVNKAVREVLVADRGQYLLPDILKLFSSTARAKSLRGYPVSHFDAFDHIECSVIQFEGVMICGHIWLIDQVEKRALLYVNATNRYNLEEDTSMTGRANYFLLWQDGLHLQRMGIVTMDLMGYDPKSKNAAIQGVSRWKEGTHGQEETLYHHYPTWFYLLRKLRNMLP